MYDVIIAPIEAIVDWVFSFILNKIPQLGVIGAIVGVSIVINQQSLTHATLTLTLLNGKLRLRTSQLVSSRTSTSTPTTKLVRLLLLLAHNSNVQNIIKQEHYISLSAVLITERGTFLLPHTHQSSLAKFFQPTHNHLLNNFH